MSWEGLDLTFPGASDKTDLAKVIADWARLHKISAAVVGAKKSVMIRLHVPKLDIEGGFERVGKDELDQCFEAVKELTDFANIVEMASSMARG